MPRWTPRCGQKPPPAPCAIAGVAQELDRFRIFCNGFPARSGDVEDGAIFIVARSSDLTRAPDPISRASGHNFLLKFLLQHPQLCKERLVEGAEPIATPFSHLLGGLLPLPVESSDRAPYLAPRALRCKPLRPCGEVWVSVAACFRLTPSPMRSSSLLKESHNSTCVQSIRPSSDVALAAFKITAAKALRGRGVHGEAT